MVVIEAHAKINLSLLVKGKRPDGYHELETKFLGLKLSDTVTIEKEESGIILTCSNKDLACDESNLAYKAASIMMNHHKKVKGVNIHIEKRIPIGAGLAGGSADAAAVLLGINDLYELKISYEQLKVYAAMIGSDVAFCLKPTLAIGTGRGEILRYLEEKIQKYVVLIKPEYSLSTKEVYDELDKLTGEEKFFKEKFKNELLPAILKIKPEIYQDIELLRLTSADAEILITGSGPTLVALFKERTSADMLMRKWACKRYELIQTETLV